MPRLVLFIIANAVYEDLERVVPILPWWTAVRPIDGVRPAHCRDPGHGRTGAVGETHVEKVENRCRVVYRSGGAGQTVFWAVAET